MSEQLKNNQIIIEPENPESIRELSEFIDLVLQKVEKKKKEQKQENLKKNFEYRHQFVKQCLENYAEWKAISKINSPIFENERCIFSAIKKSRKQNDISRVIAKIDSDPIFRNSMVVQFEKILQVYEAECDFMGNSISERKYNVLKSYYFSVPKLQMQDIIVLYQTEFGKINKDKGKVIVDRHTIYRDLRKAIDDFSDLFWGLYNLFS